MCAKRIITKTALPAVVASMTLLSVMSAAQNTIAFQGMRGGGSGETCTFTKQLDDVSFRQRYLQKVAALQQGGTVPPNLASVEEMYSNVRQVSLFSDDDGAEQRADSLGVDQLSIECLGCHDGSDGSNVTINLKNNPFRSAGMGPASSGKSDHPIGMDYAQYAAARADDFKPLFNKSKMVLVNGKVGCLTCHDPLNKEPGHLVMSDRGSALCLTCHSK